LISVTELNGLGKFCCNSKVKGKLEFTALVANKQNPYN
jgi:hypothetical protein